MKQNYIITLALAATVSLGSIYAEEAQKIVLDLSSSSNPENIEFTEKGNWTETFNADDYPYIEFALFGFSHIIDGENYGGTTCSGFTISKSTDHDISHTYWISNQR